MNKSMIFVGFSLLAAGFVWQLVPASDVAIGDFPLGAYIAGALSGVGLCLVGFSVLKRFIDKNF